MVALFILIAYLLGSIPTSVWIGKRFYNIDVREFGSGNAGATNTFRVLGKKAGIPVLIIDILKGTLAVSLSYLSSYEQSNESFVNLQLGLGVATLLGHIFPLFAGFRGGKGVATLLGVIMCITPVSCGLALIIFLFVLFSSRMVSLSSMMAGLSYPFLLYFVMHNDNNILTVFSIIVTALLIVTHRKNIQRILRKEESKVKLFAVRIK